MPFIVVSAGSDNTDDMKVYFSNICKSRFLFSSYSGFMQIFPFEAKMAPYTVNSLKQPGPFLKFLLQTVVKLMSFHLTALWYGFQMNTFKARAPWVSIDCIPPKGVTTVWVWSSAGENGKGLFFGRIWCQNDKTRDDAIEDAHSTNDVILSIHPGAHLHPYSGDAWWRNIGYCPACSSYAVINAMYII